jgi:hypothetical protein
MCFQYLGCEIFLSGHADGTVNRSPVVYSVNSGFAVTECYIDFFPVTDG